MFPLDHWKFPRQTIATRFKDNDIGYATHGSHVAAEVIIKLDVRPSTLKLLDCMDYGAGTGRVARSIAPYFRRVTAYDPVQECIDLANRECPGLEIPNLTYTSVLPEATFDVIFASNVLEHLDEQAQHVFFQNVKKLARSGCKLVLWYHMWHNRLALEHTFGSASVSLDHDFQLKNPGSSIQVRVFTF